MNNEKRKKLYTIIDDMRKLQGRIESIMDDEQDCFDNLPEGLQQSVRGQQMEEAVDNLSLAIDSIDEVILSIEEAAI